MISWQFGAAALLLMLAYAAWSARTRRSMVGRLRLEWGRPRDATRRMDVIAEYHHARVQAGEGTSLDDRTWDDLNLDAVFARLDRTTSTLGQQLLYHRLRSRPSAAHLEAFDDLATLLENEVTLRERVQAALEPLQNPAGYDLWWLTQPGVVETKRWHVIFPALGLFMVTAALAMLVWPAALLLLIAGAVVNLPMRVMTASQVGSVVGAFRQIAPLLAAADVVQSLPAGPIRRLLGPVGDDLRRLSRLRSIARWVGRDPIAAGELASSVFELCNLLFLLDANALYFTSHELRAHGDALLRVVGAVGEVDAALSIASVRAGTIGWTRPMFASDGSVADFAGLRHPLLDDAVPNSIVLGPPFGVLVTGSNMSGKSTFVRTVGVNVVLAQTVATVFGSGYSAPRLAVRSCIGRSDDLIAGKSYYLVEVESILSLVKASAGSAAHLFLLDELFRGTNAVERIAAGEAVLSELTGDRAGDKPHLVIAATHDAELVDLLQALYMPYHLTDSLGDSGLVFEYRLKPGPATTRNAIALLAHHGAPEQVVRRALRRAAMLDEQRARSADESSRSAGVPAVDSKS
jgi:hypothetical protein